MTKEREGQAQAMARKILNYGAEYRPGETREMDWTESDGLKYRGPVEIDAELIAMAQGFVAKAYCPHGKLFLCSECNAASKAR